MNTRILLCALSGLTLIATPAMAGGQSGGSGTSAVLITADTLSSGGGQSAGSGAVAVAITASMGGIVGVVTAPAPATTNEQGFIPQILSTPLAGFDLWASQNIPAGRDNTFSGDWNGDGIPNGVAYVFGNTPVSPTGKGKMPVPPVIPNDVNVYLDRSQNLDSWALARVKWENGAPPVFAGAFSIIAGEVVDAFVSPSGRAFYRYRVVRR